MVEEHYKSLFAELQKKDAALHEEYSKQQVRLCPLCHGGDYLLEGQSLHCSGECHDVIELNKRYYIDKSSQHVWCENCYKLLREEFVCDDQTIKKSELEMKTNEHSDKEEWAQCSRCRKWYHRVCVLYNSRMCKEGKRLVFHCPLCIQDLKEGFDGPNRQLFLPRADGGWCDLSVLSVLSVVCCFECVECCESCECA